MKFRKVKQNMYINAVKRRNNNNKLKLNVISHLILKTTPEGGGDNNDVCLIEKCYLL